MNTHSYSIATDDTFLLNHIFCIMLT